MSQMVSEKHDLIKIYTYALEVYFRVVPRFACFIASSAERFKIDAENFTEIPKNV